MHRLLFRLVSAVLLLCTVAACSGVNLGNIDEQPDGREEMPGPGIFDDEQGKPAFTWSSDNKAPESSASAAPASSTSIAASPANSSTTAASASAATSASDTALSQEQAEFEQFKIWNKLRTTGADSPEYHEFQQWLEYQKFKSGQ
jgi:hypothetical protein